MIVGSFGDALFYVFVENTQQIRRRSRIWKFIALTFMHKYIHMCISTAGADQPGNGTGARATSLCDSSDVFV